MAAIVVTSLVNNYRVLPTDSPQRISEAVWPTGVSLSADARKSQQTLLGEPSFIVQGTTDTNTANSDAINLTTQGVTFPAGTVREITVVAYVVDGAAAGKVTAACMVIGGTTPAISGEVSMIAGTQTSQAYGTVEPTIDFEVVANEVIIEAVGEGADVNTWFIEVYVGRLMPLALL